jgi:hypothetical protein
MLVDPDGDPRDFPAAPSMGALIAIVEPPRMSTVP